jgi:hypothetical protein
VAIAKIRKVRTHKTDGARKISKGSAHCLTKRTQLTTEEEEEEGIVLISVSGGAILMNAEILKDSGAY